MPSATKLSVDLDSTAQYTRTANLLNAEALQSGDVASAIARDVPVTIDRHIYVSSTTGVTHDDTTLNTPSGAIPNNHTYASDRSPLDSAPAPSGETVEDHSGLAIGLPLHPDASSTCQFDDARGCQVTRARHLSAFRTAGCNHQYRLCDSRTNALSRGCSAELFMPYFRIIAQV